MIAPARILIVDDQPSSLRMLALILEARGHSVQSANSGERALKAARNQPPDLILLDIEMPEMNGFAVCEQLRINDRLQRIPVIFISAHSDPSDIVMAFAAGGVDYITKPFQIDELNARVKTHLKLRRLQMQLEESNRHLAEANRRMSRDLNAAAMIQRSFVPHEKPIIQAADFGWTYKPCDELGGDGLNIIPFADGTIGLYVLDVSGHGIEPALLSVAISRILLSGSARSNTPTPDGAQTPQATISLAPGEVAARLNQMFPFESTTFQFTTMIYGVLNPATGEFRYICAGHPGPVHVPTDAEPRIFEFTGFPIGVGDGCYEEHSLWLREHDRLYLHSDAVLETTNQSGDQFGKARVLDSVSRNRSVSLQKSVDLLLREITEWHGSKRLHDDLSILAVEFLGVPIQGSRPTETTP